MTISDKLKEFLASIDNYITCKNLKPVDISEECKIADAFTLEQLEKLTKDECFNYAYILYQYADNIGVERAQCETVSNWCQHNFDIIISHDLEEITHVIAKYEAKIASIIRSNDLAKKISEWKMTADSRLAILKNREYNMRKKADILTEKGKRL